MKRFSGQSLGAVVTVAVLAFVAIVTSREPAPGLASYASTDYAGGGFRAWAALLAHEGVSTSRFVLRPIELDDRIDTLVSAQPPAGRSDPSTRTTADLAALARWVRAGGRLVYIGRNATLTMAENQLLQLPYLLPDVGARDGLAGPLAQPVQALHELGTDRMLLVEHSGRSELADANGDIVVRYPLGRGEIVAVTDSVPFINANLAAAGNARLAYLIAVPHRFTGVVAFDDGLQGALIDRPWYRALPLAVRVTLGIAAVAAVLALIGSALPSGPPIRLRAPREPTSGEFVAALAALYARTGARAAARAILVHEALAVAARANGLEDEARPAEVAARIGDAGRAEDIRRIAEALDAPLTTDAELVAGAQLAYTIRKEWSNGGNRDGRRTAFAGRTRTRRRW